MKSIIVLFEVKSVKREKERGFDLASMFEPLLTGGQSLPLKSILAIYTRYFTRAFPATAPSALIWTKFPTYCDTHLAESLLGASSRKMA